jgi:hypothetical protein
MENAYISNRTITLLGLRFRSNYLKTSWEYIMTL